MMQVFTTLCANGDQEGAGGGGGGGRHPGVPPRTSASWDSRGRQRVTGVRGRACVEALVGGDVRDFDLMLVFPFLSPFIGFRHAGGKCA